MAKPNMDQFHEASTPRNDGAKKLDHMEVRRAKNKGYTVTHHYDNSEGGIFMHRPEVHAFGEGPETISHLMKHLGVKENEVIDHLKGRKKGKDEEAPGGKSGEEKGEKKESQGHKRAKAEERGED